MSKRSGSSCLFCEVLSGQSPAAVVAQRPEALAFLDIRPVFKGHTLVIPRVHVATFVDLPTALIEPVMSLTQAVAAAMITELGAQGSFVAMNNTVSQSVPHLHTHVVPRTKGDGLRGFFWPRERYGEGEMDLYAQRLSAALSR